MSNIKENEQFIKVYNVFFDSREDRDEFLLTPEELLTYAAIDREDHLGNREQNILPYEYLLDVTNKKNTKSNRDKLIASIKSLESKSIITVIKEEKTYISVKVNHEEMKSEQMIEESKNNFEKVFIEELKELFIKTECKPNEVYSYLLIKSEDRLDRTASIAYSLFGSKMGVTKTTAINVIKTLTEKKLITSTEAKRKSQKEYEIKVYKCNIRVKNKKLEQQESKTVTRTKLKVEPVKVEEVKTEKVSQSIVTAEEQVDDVFGSNKAAKKKTTVAPIESEVQTFSVGGFNKTTKRVPKPKVETKKTTDEAQSKPVQKEEVTMNKSAKANSSAGFDMNNLMDFDKPKVEEATIKASFDDGRPTAKKEMTAQEQLRHVNKSMRTGEDTEEYRKMVREYEYEANAF